MKKAMISQPMGKLTDEEILATREKAVNILKAIGYDALDTFFRDEYHGSGATKSAGIPNRPLHFLAKSIESMVQCDAVYFCKGWENARGCRIEHDIAVAYGLEVIEEE